MCSLNRVTRFVLACSKYYFSIFLKMRGSGILKNMVKLLISEVKIEQKRLGDDFKSPRLFRGPKIFFCVSCKVTFKSEM
jgi:hypothetical protein